MRLVKRDEIPVVAVRGANRRLVCLFVGENARAKAEEFKATIKQWHPKVRITEERRLVEHYAE